MVIFLDLNGTCEVVTPERVFQGSNNVTDITVVAPFPSTTSMQIGFILPDGLYYADKNGARYLPMEFAQQDALKRVCAWRFALPAALTEQQGDLYIAINAVSTDGNTTSYMCKQVVEESVLPAKPSPPSTDVYDYLSMYLARLDGRTADVPNLVKDIIKVAPNAIVPLYNNGIRGEKIVIEGGETAPIPVNAASTVNVPKDAWQPVYAADNTTVTGYTVTITAGQHGQMRDGAVAEDLWASFSSENNDALQGAYQGYTVDAAGNITLNVNTPIAMTVRVWNGKGLVDDVARQEIADLQTQVDDIMQSGVDLTARAQIAEERERAETAEAQLQSEIQGVNGELQGVKQLIPSTTSTDNPLANEAFVNSSINNMAAFYITSNADGNAFPTRAALLSATTFYSGGKPRVPTQNDYAIVLADESQPKGVDGSYPTTRYSYQGGTYPDGQWGFQYVVNNTSLTQAQVDAINSGITQQLVRQITVNSSDLTTERNARSSADSNLQNQINSINARLDSMGTGSGKIFNEVY